MSQRARNSVVTGLATRLPGAPSAEAFWDLLNEGRCAVSEIGSERFDKRKYLHPRPGTPGRSYTFAAGTIDDVYGFDAAFFGISPREAAQIDPQQRLLMQVTWEAIESAGLSSTDLAGTRTGVYVGASALDYHQQMLFDLSSVDTHTMTGNTLSIVSNRLSYVFDLRGPSFTVDTACSSSLVALHEAVSALEAGEIETAIVAGVNLLLSPFSFIGFSRASMLSRQGLCRAFDANGDGYVRSEGAIALVLQRKDLVSPDRVRAQIVATGTNSDGRTAGLSLPSSQAQADLLASIYLGHDFSPENLAFIEAHGTGTQVGDPAEAHALGTIVGQARSTPLPIGSAKTNVGHLEPVSGLVGLVKSILSLSHNHLPRSLHFETPNPNIDFAGLNLSVASSPMPLAPRAGEVRLAGVNSFGFGGTNAHAVVADPEPGAVEGRPAPQSSVADTAPLVISARSEEALRALARAYGERLDEAGVSPGTLSDAAVRRRELHERRLVVHGNADEKRAALEAFASSKKHPHAIEGRANPRGQRLAFAFSGNGSQWAGMGQDAYQKDKAFRRTFEELDRHFMSVSGWSLVTMLFSRDLDAEIGRTEVAQPLLFAVQVSIVEALRARGITPDATLGHSVGEVAAAWCSGMLDLPTAVRIIHARSTQQEVVRDLGGMAALLLGEADARTALEEAGLPGLEISAVNSPRSVTVSGPNESLESLSRFARKRRAALKRLDIAYPFHSALVDSIEAPLRSALGEIASNEARIPFFSSVHPDREAVTPDATYWWENVRSPVRFSAAAERLAHDGVDIIMEIGPRPILTAYLRDTLAAVGTQSVVLPSFEQSGPRVLDGESLDAVAARLVAHGAKADLDLYVGREGRYLPDLPHYPWQLVSCHVEATSDRFGGPDRASPLAGVRPRAETPTWFNVLDTELFPFLADHKVEEAVVFPATGYIEMLLSAARDWSGEEQIEIRNLDIFRPLVLDPEKSVETLVRLSPDDRVVELLTRPRLSGNDWSLHARCSYRTLAQAPEPVEAVGPIEPDAIDADTLYRLTREHGLEYGEAFRRVSRTVLTGDRSAQSYLLPSEARQDIDFSLDPTLADAGFHGLFALVANAGPRAGGMSFLPIRFDRIQLVNPGKSPSTVTIEVERASPRSLLARFDFLAPDGAIVARLTGVRFKAVQLHGSDGNRGELAYHVETQLLPANEAAEGEATSALPDLATWIGDSGIVSDKSQEAEPADDTLLLDALARSVLLEALSRTSSLPKDASDPDEPLAGLVQAALVELERHDLARKTDEGWELASPSEAAAVADLVEALTADFGTHAIETSLLLRAGEVLPGLLDGETGNERPSAFSPAMLEAWRADGSGARMLETAARRVADLLASHVDTRNSLRVLLIGAGNATAIEAIGRALPLSSASLTITDTNDARLERLERNWQVRPATRFLPFSELPGGDGSSFDLAILLGARFTQDRSVLRALAGHVVPGGWILSLRDSGTLREQLIETLAGEGASSTHGNLPGCVTWLDGPVTETDAGIRLHLARRAAVPETHVAAHDSATKDRNASPSHDSAERKQLLLLDLDGTADTETLTKLRTTLSAQGLDISIAAPGPETMPTADGSWQIALDRLTGTEIPRTLQDVAANGLVLVAAPGADSDEAGTLERLGWRLMEVLRAGLAKSGPVVLLAPGGAVYTARGNAPAPVLSGLWSMARVALNEFPDARLHLIDPDTLSASSLPALCAEISRLLADPQGERELVLRDGKRHALRLARGPELPDTRVGAADTLLQLEIPAQGSLDRLTWTRLPRCSPGDQEVEIVVEASGLNFRDVMWALGLLPEEALEDGFAGPTLGMECCGRIERVGAGVKDLAVGDRVIAFAPAAFASHVTVSRSGCVRAPESLSAEAAATIPVAFLTAYYALVELARIGEGDTVLVHGGAGGVGLAALQIARNAGARVIATAGSPEKRALLSALGADDVLDSRSLDFADEVMDLTNGEGVDIVLNSLFGEAMERSVELLKPFGRFLELGKRDYYENSHLGLRPFRRNLSYFGIDADQLLTYQPRLAERLLTRVMALFEEEALFPLPHRAFPAERAVDAFRLMQQAGHIGKIVLHPPQTHLARKEISPLSLADAGIEIVAGGFGGFGAELVRRLADRGARHVAVLSRRGGATPEAAALISEMAARDVQVSAHACDLADKASVSRTLEEIRSKGGRPITGIYHTAMVLEDALITNLTRDALSKVLAPKVTGAALLDRLTRDDPVERFVLFSSATTLVGNPGQANYVAANGYLEGLAASRRHEGLPGLAVAWGAISDAGFLARNADVGDLLARKLGRHALRAEEALDGLISMLSCPARSTPPALCGYARIDWTAARRDLALLSTPYASWLGLSADTRDGDAEQIDLAALIEGLGPQEAVARIVDLLKVEIAGILRIAGSEIDPARPLTEIGMDSLMALELRMAAERQFGIDIPLMSLANGATLNDMATRIHAAAAGDSGVALSSESRASIVQHVGAEDLAEGTDLSHLERQVEKRAKDLKSLL
jgi:acyl transferase domain-containing protein/NADPH:quinone reductase-like Zn-dependent oxidoreductase/acyl carrier protein/NADP-dependent 3-hydroxy acid dehydrogenase YdfG